MDDAEYLKFKIEKCCDTLIDTDKATGVASTTFVVLVSVALILIFAGKSESTVEVPLLGLPLERWSAAGVLLLLSAATFYKLVSFHCYAGLIKRKLVGLLDDAERTENPWFVRYPTLHFFHDEVAYEGKGWFRTVGQAVQAAVLVGGWLLPMILALVVLFSPESSVPFAVATLSGVLIIQVSALLVATGVRAQRDKLVGSLDGRREPAD